MDRMQWKESGDSATFVIVGDHYAETYEEIDGSFSLTVNKNKKRVFYQEDIVCLWQAEQLGQVVIERNVAIQERDEARREICKRESQVLNTFGGGGPEYVNPEDIAKSRKGWEGLYKE